MLYFPCTKEMPFLLPLLSDRKVLAKYGASGSCNVRRFHNRVFPVLYFFKNITR
jgi:hypothetical protein